MRIVISVSVVLRQIHRPVAAFRTTNTPKVVVVVAEVVVAVVVVVVVMVVVVERDSPDVQQRDPRLPIIRCHQKQSQQRA